MIPRNVVERTRRVEPCGASHVLGTSGRVRVRYQRARARGRPIFAKSNPSGDTNSFSMAALTSAFRGRRATFVLIRTQSLKSMDPRDRTEAQLNKLMAALLKRSPNRG